MSQDIRARKTQLVKQLSSYSLQELKALWKKTVGPGGSNKTKVQLQEGIITHYLQVWDKETKELAHKEESEKAKIDKEREAEEKAAELPKEDEDENLDTSKLPVRLVALCNFKQRIGRHRFNVREGDQFTAPRFIYDLWLKEARETGREVALTPKALSMRKLRAQRAESKGVPWKGRASKRAIQAAQEG